MSNPIYRIERYTFHSTDGLLFDTNIWMYIYGPESNLSLRYKTIYTSAFRQIRSARCRIFIDVLAISEFINTYARLIYNQLPSATKPADFKTYRQSADFKPVAATIAKTCRKILSKCERSHLIFEAVNMGPILNEYAAGDADFNDQMLAELCRANGLKLVTHDADFQVENLTILTANPRLLRSGS